MAYTSQFLSTGASPGNAGIESFFLGDKTMARMLVASCPVETALMLDEFTLTLDAPMREATNFHDAIYSILFYYTYGYLPQPLKKGAYLNPAIVKGESEEIKGYQYALDRFCDTCNAHIFQQLKQGMQGGKRASEIVPKLSVSFINPNISGPSIFSRMSRANYPVAMPELLDFVASTMSYRSGWARAGNEKSGGMYNVDMSTALRDPGMIVPKMRAQSGGFTSDTTTFSPWMNSPLQPNKPKNTATKLKNMMKRASENWAPMVYNVQWRGAFNFRKTAIPVANVAEGSFVSVYMTDDEIENTRVWPEVRRMMTYNGYTSYTEFLRDYKICRDPYIENLGNAAGGFPGLVINTIPLDRLYEKTFTALNYQVSMRGDYESTRVTEPDFLSGNPFVIPFEKNDNKRWSVKETQVTNMLHYLLLPLSDINKTRLRSSTRRFVQRIRIREQSGVFKPRSVIVPRTTATGDDRFMIELGDVSPEGKIMTYAIYNHGIENYNEGQILQYERAAGQQSVKIEIMKVEQAIPLPIVLRYSLSRQFYAKEIDDGESFSAEDRRKLSNLMGTTVTESLGQELINFERRLSRNRLGRVPMKFQPVPNSRQENGTQKYFVSEPPVPLLFLTQMWFDEMHKGEGWLATRTFTQWRKIGYLEMLKGVAGHDDAKPFKPVKYKYGSFIFERLTPVELVTPLTDESIRRQCRTIVGFQIRVVGGRLEDDYRFVATTDSDILIDNTKIRQEQLYVPRALDNDTNRYARQERPDLYRETTMLGQIHLWIPVPRYLCHASTLQIPQGLIAPTKQDMRSGNIYKIPTPLHPDHFPFNRMILSGEGGGTMSPTNFPVAITEEVALSNTNYRGVITDVRCNSDERTCDVDMIVQNKLNPGTTHLTLGYTLERNEVDDHGLYSVNEIIDFILPQTCCPGAGDLAVRVRVDEIATEAEPFSTPVVNIQVIQKVSLVDPYQIYAGGGWRTSELNSGNLNLQYTIQDRGTGYSFGDDFVIRGLNEEVIKRPAKGIVTSVDDSGSVLKVDLLDEGVGYLVANNDTVRETVNQNGNGLKVFLDVRPYKGKVTLENSAVPPHQNAACVIERLKRDGFNFHDEVIVSVQRSPIKQEDLSPPTMGSASKGVTTRASAPFLMSTGGPNGFSTAKMPIDLLFERYSGTSLRNGNAQ